MRKKLQDQAMDVVTTGPDTREAPSGTFDRPRPLRVAPAITDSQGDTVTSGLQQLFASIAEEPIPDDFLRLLDDIDASIDASTGRLSRDPGGRA